MCPARPCERSQRADMWSLDQRYVLVCVHSMLYEVIGSSSAFEPEGLDANAAGPAV